MKINFREELRTLDGEPIKDERDSSKVLTLRSAAITALMLNYKNEESLGGEEKLERYTLALKIHGDSGDADYTVEQVAKLKELIGKAYGVIVVGQAYRLLEG